jgi:hypothetical protein
MYKELEASKAPPPIAFAAEERDRIIEAFENNQGKGINYRHYQAHSTGRNENRKYCRCLEEFPLIALRLITFSPIFVNYCSQWGFTHPNSDWGTESTTL